MRSKKVVVICSGTFQFEDGRVMTIERFMNEIKEQHAAFNRFRFGYWQAGVDARNGGFADDFTSNETHAKAKDDLTSAWGLPL